MTGFCGLFPGVLRRFRFSENSVSGAEMHFADPRQNFGSVTFHELPSGLFYGRGSTS
jgi:hypothetical protein